MRGIVPLVLLALVALGCGRDVSKRTVGDLVVAFSTEPKEVRVGDAVLRAKILDKGGAPLSPPEVRFHYYPFVFRVKDAPADPDEIVRVVESVAGPDGYSAKVDFNRPGPWKITVKISRPNKEPILTTFTVEVQGKSG